MKKVTYLVCCVGLALQSCQSGQVKNENPFFNTYGTPYEVPPFHLIKNQHYLPAYEEGMKQHQVEIDAIINNPEAPTFKNTIDALETSGEERTRTIRSRPLPKRLLQNSPLTGTRST